MTTNMERWGLALAVALRRESDQTKMLAETTAQVNELIDKIQSEPNGTLYGAGTGEQTTVIRTTPNVSPASFRRVVRPGTEHLDGGSTFALTPIGDNVETFVLPAIAPCPRTAGGDMASCLEQAPHLHQADGAVKRLADL